MTVSGKNSISIHNIAVGEVWVCSGESNMEYKVIAARNGREEMEEADLPMVRVFMVKHAAAEKPTADCEGAWVVCDTAGRIFRTAPWATGWVCRRRRFGQMGRRRGPGQPASLREALRPGIDTGSHEYRVTFYVAFRAVSYTHLSTSFSRE